MRDGIDLFNAIWAAYMRLLIVVVLILMPVVAFRAYTGWPLLAMPIDRTDECPDINSWDSYDVLISKENRCQDYYSKH
jgi:hypothetical protein